MQRRQLDAELHTDARHPAAPVVEHLRARRHWQQTHLEAGDDRQLGHARLGAASFDRDTHDRRVIHPDGAGLRHTDLELLLRCGGGGEHYRNHQDCKCANHQSRSTARRRLD